MDLLIWPCLIFLIFFVLHLKSRISSLSYRLQVLEKNTRESQKNSQHDDTVDQASQRSNTFDTDDNIEYPISQPAVTPLETNKEVPITKPAIKSQPYEIKASQFTPPRKQSQTPNKLWDMIYGFFTSGNSVVRVGSVILFIGLAFLLKLAASHGFIPIKLRLAGVSLVGAVLFAIGWKLKDKRVGFSRALQGISIAILYLVSFAAYYYYDFIGPVTCISINIVLAISLLILAFKQDSISLACLAMIGSFLAPIILHQDIGSVFIYSYYLLLNVVIATIIWKKPWRLLALIGFFFTFVNASSVIHSSMDFGGIWHAISYNPHFITTEIFLTLQFLVYLIIPAFQARHKLTRGFVDSSIIFALPIAVGITQAIFIKYAAHPLAISLAVITAIYFVAAYLLKIKENDNEFQLLRQAYTTIGFIFFSLIWLQIFSKLHTSIVWAIEGAALAWLGYRQRNNSTLIISVCLQLAALFLSAFYYFDIITIPSPQFEIFTLVSAVCFCITGYYLWKSEKRLSAALYTVGLCLWLYALAKITNSLSSLWLPHVFISAQDLNRTLMGTTASWIIPAYISIGTITTLIALMFSKISKCHYFRNTALLGFILSPLVCTLQMFASSSQGLAGLAPWHAILAWLVNFFILYLALKQEQKIQDRFTKYAFILFGYIITYALTVCAAYSIGWPDNYAICMFGLTPALCTFAVYFATKHHRLFIPRKADYQNYFLLPLTQYLLAWGLIANFILTGNVSPLPYIPFLNIIDISMLISFFAAYWIIRNDQHLTSQHKSRIAIELGIVAFIWTNAVILRSIHMYLHVPAHLYNFYASQAAQISISIYWGLAALIITTLASIKKWRAAWFAGAVMIGLVVLKLFFIDLANIDTLGRIFVFIAVGVSLILIGYFSPVPPKIRIDQSVCE